MAGYEKPAQWTNVITETRVGPFRGPASFLSNFHPAEIPYHGHVWPTAEHAYQASKFQADSPPYRQIALLRAPHGNAPGRAKQIGRTGEAKYRVEMTDAHRFFVMKEILVLKFSLEKHPSLAEMLEMTGDRELVELNSWGDTFWGVCDGRGTNYLGKILMAVRARNRSLMAQARF